MSFDEWIQDESPGGVDAIRAADMRLAWEAAMMQAAAYYYDDLKAMEDDQ